MESIMLTITFSVLFTFVASAQQGGAVTNAAPVTGKFADTSVTISGAESWRYKITTTAPRIKRPVVAWYCVLELTTKPYKREIYFQEERDHEPGCGDGKNVSMNEPTIPSRELADVSGSAKVDPWKYINNTPQALASHFGEWQIAVSRKKILATRFELWQDGCLLDAVNTPDTNTLKRLTLPSEWWKKSREL